MRPYHADESVTLYHGDALEMTSPATEQPTDADAAKPVAGDEYNGFTLVAYEIPDNRQDYRVEFRNDGELVREFLYPAYRIYTLLAHWREYDEVNPPTAEVAG
jgi:hypothetical protein